MPPCCNSGWIGAPMSETTTPNKVAIVGVGGFSEIGRRLDRPLGLLAVDAARAAIADAGLTLADIDGVSTFPMFPPSGNTGETGEGISTVGTSWMIHNLGMSNVRWWAESQMGNISTSIEQAAMAIETGRCDYAWSGGRCTCRGPAATTAAGGGRTRRRRRCLHLPPLRPCGRGPPDGGVRAVLHALPEAVRRRAQAPGDAGGYPAQGGQPQPAGLLPGQAADPG